MDAYHYTESGLDNVMLFGLTECVDDAGDKVIDIPNITSLHREIARGIITSQAGVTPKELRFLRTEMEMTQSELAVVLQKDHQTIGRWERGETSIDSNAEAIIRIMAAERLGLMLGITIEELASRCVPQAAAANINIDASNPEEYRLMAA